MSESPHVVEATRDNFGDIVEKSREIPVLVDFWAEWCGPCKQLMPVLAKLADEYNGQFLLAKVDTEAQTELASHFGIRSIPTVKVINDGQIVDEFTGVVPESQIRELIDKYIDAEADGGTSPDQSLDPLSQAALGLASAGNMEGAIAALEQGLTEAPDNHAARITLSQFQIAAGQLDGAEASLNAIPEDARDARYKTFDGMLYFVRITENSRDEDTLVRALENDSTDCQAMLELGARRMMENRHVDGLDHFLSIVQCDRKFNDDAGRNSMIKAFDMLGSEHDLTFEYRRKLYTALN